MLPQCDLICIYLNYLNNQDNIFKIQAEKEKTQTTHCAFVKEPITKRVLSLNN